MDFCHADSDFFRHYFIFETLGAKNSMTMFMTGFLLCISLCLDLGIVNVAILRAGVERGFWPSFMIGVGSSFGDLTYAVLSVMGVSYILNQFTVLRWILWIGGTLVLIYMTVQMLRASLSPKVILGSENNVKITRRRWYRDAAWGLGLALSSPSVILWFAMVGGSIVASQGDQIKGALIPFLLGFFTASIVWSFFMALISSEGGKRMGARLHQGFSILSSMLFLYLAIHVFMNGYTEFVR
jgi:L-lysine exporter family protein LysE/ArgO